MSAFIGCPWCHLRVQGCRCVTSCGQAHCDAEPSSGRRRSAVHDLHERLAELLCAVTGFDPFAVRADDCACRVVTGYRPQFPPFAARIVAAAMRQPEVP